MVVMVEVSCYVTCTTLSSLPFPFLPPPLPKHKISRIPNVTLVQYEIDRVFVAFDFRVKLAMLQMC